MNTQFELRTTVSNELATLLGDYFIENELPDWGILRRGRHDPYELFGIFPDSDTADAALANLRTDFPDLPEDFTFKTIEANDWQNAYKAFLKPWQDRQLHWIPLGERDTCSVPEDAVSVYLDAGMVFGTGAHETTRLCARRLLDYYETHGESLDKCRVIDAGCGSGILALSASALGFKTVSGFDIDPEAIAVCKQNVAENPHIPPPKFSISDLEEGLDGKQADLILANIQSHVLIRFSRPLIQSVARPGTLVLSGILTQEVEDVCTHFTAEISKLHPETVFDIHSHKAGEWSDLQFTLPAK